jgi:hypothetical protein
MPRVENKEYWKVQDRCIITYKRKLIKITKDFSAETLKTGQHEQYFSNPETKQLQNKIMISWKVIL